MTKTIQITICMPVTLTVTANDCSGVVEIDSIDQSNAEISDIYYTDDVIDEIKAAWSTAGY